MTCTGSIAASGVGARVQARDVPVIEGVEELLQGLTWPRAAAYSESNF